MGYNTRVEGEFTITPPLTWAEVKASPFAPSDTVCDAFNVQVHVEEAITETDEGSMVRRQGVLLVPSWEEGFKAYHLVEHVQKAVDSFPGHTFAGHLHCEGEEAGDLWRVVVRDGRAVKVTPTIVWPDETEVAAPCACYPDPADHEPGRPCALCATCGGDGFHQVGCEVAR